MILDGENVIDIDNGNYGIIGNDGIINKTISDGKVSFTHSGIGYCYVQTTKYTSAQLIHYQNLGVSLAGMVSIIGFPISVIMFLKSALDGAGKNLWYTVKTYCDTSYRYYAYKTNSYTNAGRTKLYSSSTKYVKMW